jgi:hypothetical protein
LSTRSQIFAAVLLAIATYGVLVRIAEAKVERAVGSGGFRLDSRRPPEMEAFERERASLAAMGQQPLADRLEKLRADGVLWVAPGLGADHWAVFAEALGLARRIYIRRVALLDPAQHLFPAGSGAIPDENQRAFARLGLSGALRHELAHFDGMMEEADAYAAEIAWYESLRATPWFASLAPDRRRVYDWALTSAVMTARRARETAAPAGVR